MIKGKRIYVVIPAYNEEKNILKVLETLPSFVDMAVVVDDCSKDTTVKLAEQFKEKRTGVRCQLIIHARNRGVGATIVSGYRRAREEKADVCAVMAGDGQMDPKELELIVMPVVDNQAEYVKGNRLIHANVWQIMPKYRFLGNSFLSLLTKIASGYWKMADSQTGYTAISLSILEKLRLGSLYARYGFPNDILVKLNIVYGRVHEVPIKPIYDGQRSNIHLTKVIPTMSWLLLKGFLWRMKTKYMIRDFHPLVFFYFFGLTFFILGILFGIYLLIYRISAGPVSATSALFSALFVISGLQSLFFGMWFDMEDNKELFSKDV